MKLISFFLEIVTQRRHRYQSERGYLYCVRSTR